MARWMFSPGADVIDLESVPCNVCGVTITPDDDAWIVNVGFEHYCICAKEECKTIEALAE